MRDEQRTNFLQDALNKLNLFFPGQTPAYTLESVETGLDLREIIVLNSNMLPYLQTAFFDDKIVEVELDGVPRVYFSRIHDHLPDLEEVEEDGVIVLREPLYKPGDYLKEMTHLISLPLEPGMGNLHIRNSKRVVLRFFTSVCAIELGTSCEDMTEVRGLPVLRLSYPIIARLAAKTRNYRAKVPTTFDLLLIVSGKGKNHNLQCRVVEVSVSGMSFLIQKEEQKLFRVSESLTLEFIMDGLVYTTVTAIVRHVSKIRGKGGTEFRCGVQFELITWAQNSEIESIVATIQRVHLQELAEKSEENRVDLIR